MNRCTATTRTEPHPHRSSRRHWLGHGLLACLGLTLGAASVWAQPAVRSFPPKTERGAMVITQPPELLLNGRVERFSPGARIRGPNNLLILSGTLVGQNLLVNYLRESHGLIHEVWILTEAEAALPLPKATP